MTNNLLPFGHGKTQIQQPIHKTFFFYLHTALTTLNGWRADYGSTEVQLNSAVDNMKNQITNLQNAEDQIRVADMAAESANFNKMNILQFMN